MCSSVKFINHPHAIDTAIKGTHGSDKVVKGPHAGIGKRPCQPTAVKKPLLSPMALIDKAIRVPMQCND